MYATHRPITGHTDVYAVNPQAGNTVESQDYDDIESEELGYTDEAGQAFLMRPGKKSKGGGIPWAAESPRRGAVANFRNVPNSTYGGKGKSKGQKGPCLRCGDSNRWHRDRPLPWMEVLGPKITGKGKSQPKGQGESETFLTNDDPLTIIPEETAGGITN